MREIIWRLLFQYLILCRIVRNFDLSIKILLLIRGMQIENEINRPSLFLKGLKEEDPIILDE